MEENKLEALIEAVIAELGVELARSDGIGPAPAEPVPSPAAPPPPPAPGRGGPGLDLPDPMSPEARALPGLRDALDAEGLLALRETTTARIGVGRAGPRARTRDLLVFQADLAITKDALERKVAQALLDEFGLFTVGTRVSGGRSEYLLRPDLGRRLSDAAIATVKERCAKQPDVQVCVGDGLSARAIEANLARIFPVLKTGCASLGYTLGTPFFIENCRVGVMNDLGDLLDPKVLILLIGERPGLGRAESMSAYMAYRPKSGHSDADRNVICNIFDGGGVNPLEAGAYALRLAQDMMGKSASGVKLKLMEGEA